MDESSINNSVTPGDGTDNSDPISKEKVMEKQRANIPQIEYLSKDELNNKFLVNDNQEIPDSILKINCTPHNKPAIFFSKKLNLYKCYTCLIQEQDLIYIDNRFK
jgi:hypothetical protein